MSSSRLCIVGEVLFDHFPDGKRVLGGAPFNVAWHLQAFGQLPYFVSRVGADAEADEVLGAMRQWGMDTEGVQLDSQLPTGKVSIQFENGEPQYDIVHPCAYDAIDANSLASQSCRLLYHGSLALRDTVSAGAVEQLKSCKPGIVFVDVNLRPPWWQPQRVLEMVRSADWVKLNTDELDSLHAAQGDSVARAADFLEHYDLRGLVLTHGGEGAEVLTASGEHHTIRPESNIEIVDTVGAGDSFAAVIILGLTHDWPLQVTLERAQTFASKLVTRRGATVSDMVFYQPFIDLWKLQV